MMLDNVPSRKATTRKSPVKSGSRKGKRESMGSPPAQKRSAGRPRSAEAHQAVLDATNRMLKTVSVRDLTIEGIASEAGVGKPTIYRWWPSKNAVVLDAVFSSVYYEIQYAKTDSAVAALTEQISHVIKVLDSRPGQILAELIAEGQTDTETLESLNQRFLSIRRTAARKVIEGGKQAGEIAEDVDVELAIDLLYAPLYHRLLAKHQPLDQRFAADLVDWALRGLSPR